MEKEKSLVLSLLVQLSELTSGLVFASVSILAFFTPFTLGHPQWLVGTVVNACLFLTAIYLPKKYFIPLSILPSLGVLARGLIFGPLTLFLVYFLPFIWLGNLTLLLVFKKLFSKSRFIFASVISSVTKFLFLFLLANIYLKLSIVPAVFLQAMGLNQLATALVGGLTAFIIFKTYARFFGRGNGAS